MSRALRLISPVALAVLVIAAFAVLKATPATASGSLETIFQDDTQLHNNTSGTLSTLRLLGVDRVRLFVYWGSIAPASKSLHKPSGFSASDPNSYPDANWVYYDNVVAQAQKAGIAVDFTVTGGAPLWATGNGYPGPGPARPRGAWKPSAAEFGGFVHALGTRYSGHFAPANGAATPPAVRYWAIWNEPNYGQWLAPQAIPHHEAIEQSPTIYRNLVDAAWTALHQTGHGADTFLFGETAPRGVTLGDVPGNFGGMVPLRFLRALYCVDSSYNQLRGGAAAARGCPTSAAGSRGFQAAHPALFHATGFADHAYPQGLNPVRHTWPNPGMDQYADLPQIPALQSLLDRVNRVYGSSTRFNIYNTEYGYQTNPPAAGHPSYATTASWLNWAEYISWRNPRLRTFMQYGLVDPPLNNFPSSLEDNRGRPKQPVFDAFRLPLYLPVTSTRHGRSLEVWGAVRPAHAFPGLHQALIQFQRGSHGPWTLVRSIGVSGRGYFDVRITFAASGSVRLAWTDAGSALYGRTQKISLH